MDASHHCLQPLHEGPPLPQPCPPKEEREKRSGLRPSRAAGSNTLGMVFSLFCFGRERWGGEAPSCWLRSRGSGEMRPWYGRVASIWFNFWFNLVQFGSIWFNLVQLA